MWVAIPVEHQASLLSSLPNAKPVRIMGKDISGWIVLSPEATDFEETALHACELVTKKDRRIGKVPKKK